MAVLAPNDWIRDPNPELNGGRSPVASTDRKIGQKIGSKFGLCKKWACILGRVRSVCPVHRPNFVVWQRVTRNHQAGMGFAKNVVVQYRPQTESLE
jgi:hypothetical protein